MRGEEPDVSIEIECVRGPFAAPILKCVSRLRSVQDKDLVISALEVIKESQHEH
jgi:hypothetical protein